MNTVLQKTTTVEAIVNLLVDRIRGGIYKPGEKLPSERRLQEELGVGRLALRESLSRLNAMGIIVTAHGRGTFVQQNVQSKTFCDVLVPYFAESDPKRLRDLVIAREMLESEIAGLAAQQRTDEQLAALHAVVHYEFPDDASWERVAEHDLLFHRLLAESIDNEFLTTMHTALTEHIRLFLEGYVKSKATAEEVMRAHLPILEAIKRKDSKAARHHARLHISYSVRDYEEYVAKSKKEK